MARPKVFVSSTYYDLKHIRNSLNVFIEGLGYEPVLYEQGDIPFHHDAPLDISCYEEIESCHILVFIIGGRYGSSTSDTELAAGTELYNSITKKNMRLREKRIFQSIFSLRRMFILNATHIKRTEVIARFHMLTLIMLVFSSS
jgi:hypothetical protein